MTLKQDGFMDNYNELDVIAEYSIAETQKEPSVFAEVSDLKNKLDEIQVLMHASQLHKVMTGNFGLSEKQEEKLQHLKDRQAGKLQDKRGKVLSLTENMLNEMMDLIDQKNNPSIGETARSYIDEMITSHWYGIPKDMHSKYTAHGNACEQFSIDMLNLFLKKNFIKNEETRKDVNYLLIGTPDVITETAIIDIKNPYDTFTYDKKRNVKMDLRDHVNSKIDAEQKEYYWQGQAYMHLFDKEVFYLVYTLNENYYMDGNEYENLSFHDRVIVNKIPRDREAFQRYIDRIPVIKKTIKEQIEKRKESLSQTAQLINELKLLK